MTTRHIALVFELVALLIAPVISNASTSSKLNFSGRIFMMGCLIDQQDKSVQFVCGKSPQKQHVNIASHSPSSTEFALPDNRGEAHVLWLNTQHTQGELIVNYR